MSKEATLAIYNQIGWITLGVSVVVLALSPIVQKWMHLDTLRDHDSDVAGADELGEPQAAGIHPEPRPAHSAWSEGSGEACSPPPCSPLPVPRPLFAPPNPLPL